VPAGIATVVASGNDGAPVVDSPACISSAVAVASVSSDGNTPSGFSNISPAISFYAPGESILSSVPAGTPEIPGILHLESCLTPPGTTCGYASGTSMATPHVAGAFAVLRQARPGLAVDNEVDLLEGTGRQNNFVGLSFPFLNEGNAVTQVRPTSFPGGVAQNKDGRFEAFMANANGVYDKWQKAINSGWSGWVGRGGPVRNPVITASDFDGRLEVFGTSSNGTLYHAWQTSPGGSWSGWASLGGAVSGNHFTVLMNADGHLEIVMVTTGNVIEHSWQRGPGGPWTPWHSFGVTVPGVRGITSVRLPDGEGFAAIITGKGELIADVQDQLFGAWDNWAILNPPIGTPSPAMVGNPVVGVDLDNRLEVMAADTSGRVWSYYESSAQALDIFTHRARIISGGVTSGRMAVGHDGDGRLELFDARPGGSIIDMWQKSPGSSWGGPSVLSSSAGEIPSPIQAMSTVDGRIELFSAQGSDHDWQVNANGPWSGWRPF
jgi:subtilisin family serine protease